MKLEMQSHYDEYDDDDDDVYHPLLWSVEKEEVPRELVPLDEDLTKMTWHFSKVQSTHPRNLLDRKSQYSEHISVLIFRSRETVSV